MSNHEITIGDASVTFEQVQVEVELDYDDVWMNIEEAVADSASNVVDDRSWDAVEDQVYGAISDQVGEAVSDSWHSVMEEFLQYYINTSEESMTSLNHIFQLAVWKAISRLDEAQSSPIAAQAREYLLSCGPRPMQTITEDIVTKVVRREIITLLDTVRMDFSHIRMDYWNKETGAEIAITPNG